MAQIDFEFIEMFNIRLVINLKKEHQYPYHIYEGGGCLFIVYLIVIEDFDCFVCLFNLLYFVGNKMLYEREYMCSPHIIYFGRTTGGKKYD